MWLAGGFDSNAKGGYNADAQREATSALLAMATNNEPLQGLISLPQIASDAYDCL
jgi:hypothetical protein